MTTRKFHEDRIAALQARHGGKLVRLDEAKRDLDKIIESLTILEGKKWHEVSAVRITQSGEIDSLVLEIRRLKIKIRDAETDLANFDLEEVSAEWIKLHKEVEERKVILLASQNEIRNLVSNPSRDDFRKQRIADEKAHLADLMLAQDSTLKLLDKARRRKADLMRDIEQRLAEDRGDAQQAMAEAKKTYAGWIAQ